MLHPTEKPRKLRYVEKTLENDESASVHRGRAISCGSLPDQVITRWVPGGLFTTLGTDGFGRSDTREALRRFFEVDTGHVVVAVLSSLADIGQIGPSVVADAIERYGIDVDAPDPADPDNRPNPQVTPSGDRRRIGD